VGDTIPTPVPDCNLLRKFSISSSSGIGLLPNVGSKKLAQQFIDLIGCVLDEERLALLVDLYLSAPVPLGPPRTSAALGDRL
jgi:hypothetical protein